MKKSTIYLLFCAFILGFFGHTSMIFAQKFMELKQVPKPTLDSLDKLYFYVDKQYRPQLSKAWENTINKWGTFLTEKKLNWDKLKVFNTFYFNELGKVDYYFYNFNSEVSPENKALFKQYAQEFFKDFLFNFEVINYDKKIFQCGGMTVIFRNKEQEEKNLLAQKQLAESNQIKGAQMGELTTLAQKTAEENLKISLLGRWFLTKVDIDTASLNKTQQEEYFRGLSKNKLNELQEKHKINVLYEYMHFFEDGQFFYVGKDFGDYPFHHLKSTYKIDASKKTLTRFDDITRLTPLKTFSPNYGLDIKTQDKTQKDKDKIDFPKITDKILKIDAETLILQGDYSIFTYKRKR